MKVSDNDAQVFTVFRGACRVYVPYYRQLPLKALESKNWQHKALAWVCILISNLMPCTVLNSLMCAEYNVETCLIGCVGGVQIFFARDMY